MNDDSILGSAFGQLGQTVKQGVKQVVKIPEEMAKDVSGQVGASNPAASAESAPLRESSSEASEPKQQWSSDDERIKYLRDLYGKSDMPQDGSLKVNQQATPEEQKKLLELRNQLHKQVYYDPTFNPVKKQEERPAEKVENEKMQEMQDLQKKEEKKTPPLAIQRASERVEKFPGASG